MLRSVSALCAAVMLSLGVGLVLPSAATASVEGGTVSVAVVVQRPAPDFKPAPGKDKGSGNSDAARSCGQGGYLDRFDATTGTGFRTPGACVAHAASGGVQATITLASTTYSCADDPGATCWGIVVGSGLLPASPVAVLGPDTAWEPAKVDESGSVSAPAQIPCTFAQDQNFFAVAYIAGTTRISSRYVQPPCPPLG